MKKGDNLSHKILDVRQILLANLPTTFSSKLKACNGGQKVDFVQLLANYFKNTMLVVSQEQLMAITNTKISNNERLQRLKEHISNSANNIKMVVLREVVRTQPTSIDALGSSESSEEHNNMLTTTTTTTTTTTPTKPTAQADVLLSTTIPVSTTSLEITPVVDES